MINIQEVVAQPFDRVGPGLPGEVEVLAAGYPFRQCYLLYVAVADLTCCGTS
jgi:hypothetical protein